jgi:hypothetical protein
MKSFAQWLFSPIIISKIIHNFGVDTIRYLDSRNTIKVHLKGLVQKRLLTPEGKGKGTWYRP